MGLQQTRAVKDLRNWDKNPRKIHEEDFARLKRQITKLGQYKPLLITPDGTVIGGNMRLRAYRELGIKRAWVSVVDVTTEKEMLEYALSDNDRAGEYDQEGLAELILATPELEIEDFKVDLGSLTGLDDLVNKFQPSDDDEEQQAPPPREIECPECGAKFEEKYG